LPELLSTVSDSQIDAQEGTEELGIYGNKAFITGKGPNMWP